MVAESMDARAAQEIFNRDGFVVLPGYLGARDLAGALSAVGADLPTADAFHDSPPDDPHHVRFKDEFGGISNFPFDTPQLSLLAVHPRLLDLAAVLLGTSDLRAYSIESWAKFTGAADYDQPHHRDYLNHSVLVPAADQPPTQVEMFVYLCDVPVELGPPSYVPRRHTEGMPALPNWYPREDGAPDDHEPRWVSASGRPDLYDVEVRAAGPVGTVAAYRIETFHRGTALQAHRGARYTIHTNFRRADAEWIGRHSWADASLEPGWRDFVVRASPRQLQLFGFPPPGHAYWTEQTARGMTERYPGFDPRPWLGSS